MLRLLHFPADQGIHRRGAESAKIFFADRICQRLDRRESKSALCLPYRSRLSVDGLSNAP
jgi:hypothetical protein